MSRKLTSLALSLYRRQAGQDGDGVIGAGEFDTATLTYDALGRATAGLRPDWYTTQAQYDAVDRVVRGTDAVGQLRDYSYDPNGNLLAETLRVNNVQLDQRLRSYDLSDRLLAKVDSGASLGYQYDPAGNVTAITNADGCKFSVNLRHLFSPGMRLRLGHCLRDGQSRSRREGGCLQPWHGARSSS